MCRVWISELLSFWTTDRCFMKALCVCWVWPEDGQTLTSCRRSLGRWKSCYCAGSWGPGAWRASQCWRLRRTRWRRQQAPLLHPEQAAPPADPWLCWSASSSINCSLPHKCSWSGMSGALRQPEPPPAILTAPLQLLNFPLTALHTQTQEVQLRVFRSSAKLHYTPGS